MAAPKPPDFWTSLYGLHQKAILCDLHFYVNSSEPHVDYEVIPAHKVVLAASSSYFHTALTGEQSIQDFYHLDGIKKSSLQLILDYVYRQVTWQDVVADQEVLTAAEALGIYQHDKQGSHINTKNKAIPRVVFLEVDNCGKRNIVEDLELNAKHMSPKVTNTTSSVNCQADQKKKKAYSLLTGLERKAGANHKSLAKSYDSLVEVSAENEHGRDSYSDTYLESNDMEEDNLIGSCKLPTTESINSHLIDSPINEVPTFVGYVSSCYGTSEKTESFDQNVIVEFNESDQFPLSASGAESENFPVCSASARSNQAGVSTDHRTDVNVTLPTGDIDSAITDSHTSLKLPMSIVTSQYNSENRLTEMPQSDSKPSFCTVDLGYSCGNGDESKHQDSSEKLECNMQSDLSCPTPAVSVRNKNQYSVRRSSRTPKPSRLLREMDSTFKLQKLLNCETVSSGEAEGVKSSVILESHEVAARQVLKDGNFKVSSKQGTKDKLDVVTGATSMANNSRFCDTDAVLDTVVISKTYGANASCKVDTDAKVFMEDLNQVSVDSDDDNQVHSARGGSSLTVTNVVENRYTLARCNIDEDCADLPEVKIEIHELGENRASCDSSDVDHKMELTKTMSESVGAEPWDDEYNKWPDEHLQPVAKGKATEKVRLYQCQICHRHFRGLTGIVHHERKMHQIHREYPCPECAERYRCQRDLDLHLSKVHHHVSFHCEECGAKFRSKLGHKMHVEKQHGNAPPGHICDICGKTFHLRQDLLSHQLYRHSDARPFHCKLCQRAFKAKNMLLRHSNTVHSNERKFQCDVCGVMFKTRNDAKRHRERHFTKKGPVRARHSKIDPQENYPCSFCAKVFKKRRLQLNHEKLQHHEKSAGVSFTCTLCSRSFPIKHYLMQHIKNCHTPARYRCHDCQAEFIQSSDLRRHRETPGRCKGGISQPKPYSCQQCSRGFSLKSNLMKHVNQPGRCKGPKQLGSDVLVVVKMTEDDRDPSADDGNDMPEGSLQILEVDNEDETYVVDFNKQSTLQLHGQVELGQRSEVMELHLGGQEMQEVQIEVIPDISNHMTLATLDGQTLRLMSDIAGLNAGRVTIAGQALQTSFIAATDSKSQSSSGKQLPGNGVAMVTNVPEKSCDQVALVTSVSHASGGDVGMATDTSGVGH